MDRELILTLETKNLPAAISNMLLGINAPIEWNDGMPMMNWLTTGKEITWVLRDPATGKQNMDIDWRFRRGDVVKIRIFNDPSTSHAMAHPIHLHGQRFLVLTRDGVRSDNLVWKDTAIIPAGETVELLADMSNPGSMDDALPHRRAFERGDDGGVRGRVGQGIPPKSQEKGHASNRSSHRPARDHRARGSRVAAASQAGAAASPRTLSPAFRQYVAVDAPVVAITHAKLIDGTGTPAKNDQTILIRGEKIATRRTAVERRRCRPARRSSMQRASR